MRNDVTIHQSISFLKPNKIRLTHSTTCINLSSRLDASTFPFVLLHPKQALDGRVATGNVTARVKKANVETIQQSERLEHRFNVTCYTTQTP